MGVAANISRDRRRLGSGARHSSYPARDVDPRASVSHKGDCDRSVTVDGKPAVSVHLKLDGADSGNTDAGGRFLLTEVGKGPHRLHLELLGANPRDEVFSVASGQTALQVGNLEMDPLVRLGYTPYVYIPAQQVDYDITLWIIGDPDVPSRIKSVSYILPAPLTPHPVSGASANHAFCYRQTGSLSIQDFPLGNNSTPVLALAIVDLGGGKHFQISAPVGTTRPPDCPAQQAGSASPVSTTPAQSQQPSPSPRQSGSSPASSATLMTDVPDVIGDSQATANSVLTQAGFQVNVQQGPGSAQYPNGTVFKQVPGSGSAAKGSTVIIYVQTGASPSASASASTPSP